MKKTVAAAPPQGPKTDAPAEDYVTRLEAELKKKN
jgi:hypothetical protein